MGTVRTDQQAAAAGQGTHRVAEGLFLRVTAAGSRAWVTRSTTTKTRPDGKSYRANEVRVLGKPPAMSIGDAKLASAGGSLAQKLGTGSVATCRDSLAQWYAVVEPRLRPGTYRTLGVSVRALQNTLGSTKVRHLTLENVTDAVDKYVAGSARCRASKTGGSSARRAMLSAASGWLRWAKSKGQVPVSPVQDMERHLIAPKPAPRDRVLTVDEMRALWHADCIHRGLWRFLLATGCRIGEALLSTVADVQVLEGRVFLHVAKGRHKGGRDHYIPLSSLALSECRLAGEPSSAVVCGRRAVTVQQALSEWRERAGVAHFTPHDLRRTAASIWDEELELPHELIARCLGHSLETVTAKHYLKSPKFRARAEALDQWANWLAVNVAVTAGNAA